MNNNVINEIRSNVNLIDVVSNYLPLTKKGKNYFGVCPFHDDHSPSMSVSEEKQIYTCFSCGATGNVFKFLQDYENISFLEAVKKCADMCGIEFTYGKKQSNNRYQELYDIYKLSSKLYQNNLYSKEGSVARKYLHDRGLSDDVIKEFQIGLSLDKNIITDSLKNKYDEKTLITSGLINESEYNLYDIYRDRIMFPLYDLVGNIVGYNGRIYKTNSKDSKYINSKETPIFKKSNLLFNYHRSKEHARLSKAIIIVEGQIDTIRCYEIGVKNVVASLGTAITKEHAMLLRKLSSNIILCFDGDSAGEKATNTAIIELEKLGITPKIVRLENDLDPDLYILKNGKDKFFEKINNPYTVIEYKELLLKKNVDLNSKEELANYTNLMIKEISNINDEVLREISINKLAEETKLDPKFIKSKLEPTKKIEFIVPKKTSLKLSKYEKSEQALLYYMLRSEDVIKIFEKKITHMPTKEYRSLAFQIDCFYKEHGYINMADLITDLKDDKEAIKTIGLINSLELNEEVDSEAIYDYLENIKKYNEKNISNNYKKQLYEEKSIERKLELAQKAIAYKIRSEENERD